MDDAAPPDPLAVLRGNRLRYAPMQNKYCDSVHLSESHARLFFSVSTRAVTSEPIRRGASPHPQLKLTSEVAPDRLKSLYSDARSIFILPDGAFRDPPLHAIRPGKPCAVQCIDAGGSLLSRPDPLRRLGRFPLRFLSLRGCGLLELPPELLELPRTLRHLDLSCNLLPEVPRAAQWRQLRGLNLSENGFLGWPQVLASEPFPDLEFLSLAGNAIGDAPERPSGLRRLVFLDCSHTRLRAPPGWLADCERLRVLRLGGATLCARLPADYLTLFPSLRFADLSGVGAAGEPLAFPAELLLFIGGRAAEPGVR
jgi:hypothetical protein